MRRTSRGNGHHRAEGKRPNHTAAAAERAVNRGATSTQPARVEESQTRKAVTLETDRPRSRASRNTTPSNEQHPSLATVELPV